MINRSTILAAVAGGVAVVGVLSSCSSASGPAGGSATNQSAAVSPAQQAVESNPPGDIPDNQAFVVYTSPDGAYSVKYPEGWGQTAAGANTVFSDKFNSITLAPHDGFYQPTEAFARTVELPQIAASTTGFTPGQISTVQRSAGQVVLITYQGDSAPSPVTGKSVKQDVARYEFSHSGRGMVVTMAAPAGSDNVDPWRIVTDSFTWLK